MRNALSSPASRFVLASALLLVAATAQSHPLDAAAAAFRPYLAERAGESAAAAGTMRERIAAADLAGAQAAWVAARGGWESVETVSDEFFPDLDKAIDAWPDAKAGFHAIEARLFGAHSTDVLAEADALLASLREFQRAVAGATLTAQGLLNGSAKLAYEIGESKAEGGESPYSGNSIVEVGDNVAGIKAAYQSVFAAAVKASDPGLDAAMLSDLDRLRALVEGADVKTLDQAALRQLSEDLVTRLQAIAPVVGLETPGLEN
jgi:iron uptake system EfeUOB component EfeO/EfeM